MELLSEFFDPIPLAAMIAAVFAVVFILAIAKIFRMPEDFADKEQVRMELRFRLAEENAAAELAEKRGEEAAAQEAHHTEEPAPETPAAADKPPETAKP